MVGTIGIPTSVTDGKSPLHIFWHHSGRVEILCERLWAYTVTIVR